MLMTELVPSLQKLVDTRLDNIDRALMSTDMSRAERKQIVNAVEDQIFEMLGRLNRYDPSREDIISVLAELDPPEAYVGTVAGHSVTSRGREASTDARQINALVPAKVNVLAVIALIFTALSAAISTCWWVLDLSGLILVFLFALPTSVLGIVATCQVADSRNRQKGLWMAILGAASPAISLAIASLAYAALSVLES